MSATAATLLAQEANVHKGPNVEMFSGTVILVPGQKPHLILTSRFCKNPVDQGLDLADNMEQLIHAAVVDGASDIAREARRYLKLPEVAETVYGNVPLENTDETATSQSASHVRDR